MQIPPGSHKISQGRLLQNWEILGQTGSWEGSGATWLKEGPGQSGKNSEQAAGEGAGLGGDWKHKVTHSEKQHTKENTE